MSTSCVVTGGARGIGRGIAELMVRRGHRVVLSDLDGAAARRTAAEIGAVAGVEQDVRDPGSHRELALLAAGHGSLTAWFNNAGVGWDGTLVELDEDRVRGLVETNLFGVLWGTRAALDAFGPAGGDVVITASLSGLGPVPGLSVYAATKAAVVSLAMSVNLEAPPGVRVHALCPDGVATDLVAGMRQDGLARQLIGSGGRLLGVQEVAAEAVALLGSRRVVRTLPGWRGAVMRGAALAPSQVHRGLAVFAAQGARAMRRT
ncbi:MAG: SDR family oxidoreductase [Nocardioides sp.]|nr:SDR family oxidoreductase [Nocardioides sp.]